jgi:hypothetical protein
MIDVAKTMIETDMRAKEGAENGERSSGGDDENEACESTRFGVHPMAAERR